MQGSYPEYRSIGSGGRFLLDIGLGLGFGLGNFRGTERTERVIEWSSKDICSEYIITGEDLTGLSV